jgi:precorrin-2/cobalt-factor-2 C20-methyltransferase
MTQLKLTAVGLGPGDPDLITVKGMQAVQAADVVFAPLNEKTGESTAITIAKPWLNREQQLVVPLALEMVRYAGTLTDVWAATANQMHDAMQTHATGHDLEAVSAVYLILGDPSLYGTFTYIAAQMTVIHPDVALTVIPGVTSFAAGAAAAGHPLAVMDERLAILPASYEVEGNKLQQTLTEFDVVILMKVGRVLPQVLDALESLNLLASSTYVEKVGMTGERIIHDLRQLPRESAPYFSLIIVRKNA